MEGKVFEYIIEDRIASDMKLYRDFIEIPFKVVDNVNILFIEFIYSDLECRLGLGIIDPTGSLRGWSAERRQRIYIARGTATPGYVAGDIISGVWKAIVRLDNIADNGCGYRLRVTGYKTVLSDTKFDDVYKILSYLTKNTDLLELVKNYFEIISIMNYTYPCRDYFKGYKASKNLSNSSMWYKGDLHIHTIHSDGRNTVCEVIALARGRGLDFIALTDHNTISQNKEFIEIGSSYEDLLVIPGMEITTFYGHMNVLNIDRYIDFRRKSKEDFKKLIEEVHNNGGVVSVNHPDISREPMCRDCPFRYRDIDDFDAIEVWNGPWHILNSESISWWHNLLIKGYKVTAIGGSDYHGVDLTRIGEPTTWIYIDSLSTENVLKSIKMGRAYITYIPDEPIIDIKAIDSNGNSYIFGDEIKASTNEYIELIIDVKKAKGSTLRIITENNIYKNIDIINNEFKHKERIKAKDIRFIRIEIGRYNDPYKLIPYNSDDLLALTNPFYIKQHNL